jgi:hypothetical protein
MIEAGHKQALAEFRFLRVLLVEFGGLVEIDAQIPTSFGITDVYHCPALGADNFIQLSKPSQSMLDCLAAMRARALELARDKVKVTDHGDSLS